MAYVVGDNLMDEIHDILKDGALVPHLDELNPNVKLAKNTNNFLGNPNKPIVSANAYLGARAIKKGLDEGADLIMCKLKLTKWPTRAHLGLQVAELRTRHP